MIAHNYVVCKMSSTKWPQFRIFLIFQDRELQELRHIINNLKEKNEMGDQGKLWKRKKYYKVSKTFFLFQCLQDGNQMITCSILKMKLLMILMGIKSREVGPRGLLSEEEGKILG